VNALYYLYVTLVFLAVVLFIEGLYLAWNASLGSEAKRIDKRLRNISAGVVESSEVKLAKTRMLSEVPALERILLSIPRVHQLDRLLVQSGLNLSVASILGLMLVTGLLGLALAILLFQLALVFGLIVSAVTASLPFFYVVRARAKRLNLIDQQLPEALDLISRAMKAGHAFSSGLKMAGDEMAEPIAEEFRITFDEVNFGISMQDALSNLAKRVPTSDMRNFVVSVLIQRETGGNLTEILSNISNLIRERLKLLGAIRVLSAEGKLSALILTLLPFVLFAIISLINPKFVKVLMEDPAGIKLTASALILMMIGIFWMWRLIKIRV
jgi:tight adherence protein B